MVHPVDPFIPIQRAANRPQHHEPRPLPKPPLRTAHLAADVPKRLRPHSRRWAYLLQLLAACAGIILIGTLLQIAYAGEVIVGLYGIWAFVRRVSSRTTFILALVSFGTILTLLVFRPDPLLMKNFATYAFLFLVVSTISLLREAHD